MFVIVIRKNVIRFWLLETRYKVKVKLALRYFTECTVLRLILHQILSSPTLWARQCIGDRLGVETAVEKVTRLL